MTSNRPLIFAAICVASVAVVVGYALLGRADHSDAMSAAPPAATIVDAARITAGPHVLFRDTALGPTYGKVGVVSLDEPGGARAFTNLNCERVYFAAGHGMCLSADRGVVTSYRGELFDAAYRVAQTMPLTGVPSRTRVSPDGRTAALTYFVGGDSYAAASFSTRTLLVDIETGQTLANLEEFAVTRGGAPFTAADFNFWGVTFARQPGRFYATLASGGTKYLIAGDVSTRTARVLRDDVECPSLSPDNRHIAFKRRMPGVRLLWRIHVLDLETGGVTPAAETRSVDDQIEWLDDRTILYALPNYVQKARPSMDIWATPADGSGQPRVLIPNAESPAVVRPSQRMITAS